MTEATTISVPHQMECDSLSTLLAAIEQANPGAPLVLRGGETFCLGLALRKDLDAQIAPALSQFTDVLFALRNHAGTTIAVVEGTAAGGGVGLAAACDVVLASDAATFGLPEVMLGLTPAIIAPFLLERMAPQAARRLMLQGEAVDAATARQLGLVDQISPDAKMDRAMSRLTRTLSRGEADAIVGARQLTSLDNLKDRVEAGARETHARLMRPETRARIAAWNEGLAPWH